MPEPEETWRLFVAIPLPQRVIAAVADLQAALRRAVPQAHVRWTPPHQFHLTLRFLGEVPAARVPALQTRLQSACSGHAALEMQLHAPGFFPHAHHPRVVWVGLQGQLNPLHALQQAVAAATADFAEKDTAPEKFSAHITLGRIKSLTPRERSDLVQAAAQQPPATPVTWRADRVQLMRSTLSREGARHECLTTWPLSLPPGAPT
ncbi:MAG: RNA 2',3'-cyclic phosphodiesterase [Verrucomicrobiae bacterium]|nr:RNA 2',3'-cyclic phosphodiesterase [Verrucomicrobiae bacterium]